METKIIAGLGNPGPQFQRTRHNIGWEIIEGLAAFLEKEGVFSGWERQAALFADIGKGMFGSQHVVLVKPIALMNNSGKAARAVLKTHRVDSENFVVIHDDIDIPIGSYKFAKNRGSAGHRGVQSIIDMLATKNFWRVRIGIQPQKGKPEDTNKFVMANFTKTEIKKLTLIMNEILQKILAL